MRADQSVVLESITTNGPDYVVGKTKYADFGPVYCETNSYESGFIVEPVNTITTIFLLMVVIFWLWKIKGSYKQYKYITGSMIFLFVAFIGNFIYHGFRAHIIFWVWDWSTLLTLAISVTAYVWWIFLGKRFVLLSIVIATVSLTSPTLIFNFLIAKEAFQVDLQNIIYAFTGIALLLPMFAWLFKNSWHGILHLIVSLTSFGVGLYFRSLESPELCESISFGTHFLWHFFAGISIAFMTQFVFMVKNAGDSHIQAN